MNIKILKIHILKLCKLHNIKIKYISNPEESCAYRYNIPIKIEIVPIKSEILYSIALHEIAHCIYKGDPFDYDDEEKAWKWVKKNALVWTDEMEKSMQKDLFSHYPSGPIN